MTISSKQRAALDAQRDLATAEAAAASLHTMWLGATPAGREAIDAAGGQARALVEACRQQLLDALAPDPPRPEQPARKK